MRKVASALIFKFGRLGRAGFGFIAVLLFCTAAVYAQGAGTIVGTITDPSGAVIPGAKVTLLNTGTGHVDVATSNAQGAYVFPTVDIGSYQLTVEISGFQTFVSQNIIMQVNENREIDAKLALGSVSQRVVVEQGQAHINTRDATLTQVVDSRRVKDLPLNGRNPLDLQTLVAGVSPNSDDFTGQSQNAGFSVHGMRTDSNNYTLNGVDNEDPYFNSPSVVPNPDALSQFSIQTSNYSAREGRGSGAQVNAVIKSGTNDFHGSLFEYWRNPVLDARPYFSTILAPYRRNQFGGTLGGPILHNKLFFFFAYQGTRTQASPNSTTLFLPSPAELQGDFSELSTVNDCNAKVVHLKNPKTKQQYSGNQIPQGDLNQASLNFASTFFPQPNGGCNSYTYTPATSADQDQYITRIDSSLGSKDTLSGSLVYTPEDDQANRKPGENLPGFLQDVTYTNWSVAVNESHVFSPRLLNLFTFGFFKIDHVESPIIPKQVTWDDLGAGTVFAAPGQPIGYDTGVSGYFNAFGSYLLTQKRREFQFSDYLSWTVGNHVLSIGGDLRQSRTIQFQAFHDNPKFTFNASHTGNALADFLTGHPQKMLQQSPNADEPHSLAPDLFFQDDWRATRQLTLNLGVRWEPYIPFSDSLGHLAQVRFGQQSTVFPQAPVGLVFPGDAGVNSTTMKARWADFSPRIGFAFDLFGNGQTSLRGGFGIFRASIPTQKYNGESDNQPYAIGISLTNPSGGLSDPYKDIGGSPFPFTPPTASERSSYEFTLPVAPQDYAPDFRNAVTYQWNLNVQQALPWQMISTIAYVGTTGEHLFYTIELNPGLASLDGGRKYAPEFSSIQRQDSGGHSSYNGLELTLNRRFRNGLTVLANYTWSKALDNTSDPGAQLANPLDPSDNRGLSDADVRNNFVTSGIWQLPGPSRHNWAADALLKGWEINAIWNMHSGNPFSVLSGVDNSESGVGLDWADVVRQPATYPHESRPQQTQRYFNIDAYALNPIGTFGNSGRNSLVGPGKDLVTLGVVKTLFAHDNLKFLLRAEAFNAFNHPTLGSPENDISSGKVGTISSAGDPRVGQLALRIEF